MAFLIYSKSTTLDKTHYINNNEHYKLAGWGLIYSLWVKRNKPTNLGWTISSDDILKQQNKFYSSNSHALIIDFHPSSTDRIGLIEIERIHLYTFGNNEGAFWTPMMLELRNVFYEEDYEDLTPEKKHGIIFDIELQPDRQKIFEFLYLNGDEQSWNWGKNGMTNAAFIHDEPRKYFSNFFSS